MSILTREIWGPALWRVLHTLARRSSSLTNAVLQTDEVHTWTHLIKTLEFMMPCALCASHYHKWVIQSKLGELAQSKGFRRQEWLENYWWSLHNEVNIRNNKSTFSKEDLKQYDDLVEFGAAYDLIKRMVSTGIQQGQLQLIAAKNALKYLEVLKRLYSV